MADASEIIALLNGFRNSCLQAGCADLLDEAIGLIERANQEITMDRAVELMNEIAYDGVMDWRKDENDHGVCSSRSLNKDVCEWTAVAIGRQIEREKKALTQSEAKSFAMTREARKEAANG